MARQKRRTRYVCSECGHETQGWLGRCPACGAWNSLAEESTAPAAVEATGSRGWLDERITAGTPAAPELTDLDAVSVETVRRVSSGLSELDRVLGSGFVPGSLVLVGGDPGIGKSTLLLQVAALAGFAGPVLYVNGEESAEQVRQRSDRLGIRSGGRIKLLPDVRFERIAEVLLGLGPGLCIIDSIQTLYTEQLAAAPGTVSQVRDTAAGLLRIAKSRGITIVLVGHVTKDGSLAGPRVLEHMVDTVLYFEGDRFSQLRLLRAAKNRFGATNEVALFEMTGQGLVGVSHASEALLAGRPREVPGSAVTASLEGTRPLLLEVQALLNPAAYGTPQRQAQGLDRSRVGMLMAVLENRLQLGFGNMDAFVNVVGGLSVDDTATDLAVAAAIASSMRNRPLRDNCLVCGEIGLTGELRPVAEPVARIREAALVGLDTVVLPGANRPGRSGRRQTDETLPAAGGRPDVIYVDRLAEAIDILFS